MLHLNFSPILVTLILIIRRAGIKIIYTRTVIVSLSPTAKPEAKFDKKKRWQKVAKKAAKKAKKR
jgi:hypothetical protein